MSGTSLAAVLVQPNEPLRLCELSVPDPLPGQIVVDLAYTGVCRSQLLEVSGMRGPDRFLPHTLGHEGSGTVAAVGAAVTKVKPGDRVVLTWIRGEGAEVPSATYRSELGAVNSGAVSTFLTRAVISENRAVRVPEALPLREAALLGCAVPTGAGTILRAAQARPGSSVAVFGVGGIGLSAILAADLMHARPLIAVDVHDHKLELAARLGATHLVDARRQDPVAAVREITGGRGVDYAIEAAGRRETMEAAFRSVRDRGGLCILAGNLPQGETISLDPLDLIRGKRVMGTWGGETAPDQDIPLYAELYLAGKLKLEPLISHEARLEDADRVLADLAAGRLARAVLRLRP